MSKSEASATWNGTITAGDGMMKPAHAEAIPFSMGTRFEGERGSNPEELIGAALAGCFSMALSLGLGQAGATPKRIQTSAEVRLEKEGDGFTITAIALRTEAEVEGIDEAAFQRAAEETKKACPVSKALGGVREITLDARLVSR